MLEGVAFKENLHFLELALYWERARQSSSALHRKLAEWVLSDPACKELLTEQNLDPQQVSQQQDALVKIFALHIPDVENTPFRIALEPPFSSHVLLATKALDPLQVSELSFVSHANQRVLDPRRMAKRVFYRRILQSYFGVSLPMRNQRSFLKIRDKDHPQKSKVFDFELDLTYSKIESRMSPDEFADPKRLALLTDQLDIDRWEEILPPDAFTFCGFKFLRVFEITNHSHISELLRSMNTHTLLDEPEALEKLQQAVEQVLEVDGLQMSILGFVSNRLYGVRSDRTLETGPSGKRSLKVEEQFLTDLIAQAMETRAPVAVPRIEDVLQHDQQLLIDYHLGYRSMSLVPVLDQDQVLGFLQFKSKRSLDFSDLTMPRLADSVPFLAQLVVRMLGEFRSAIDSLIREHCSAVHPALLWKFRDAAGEGIIQGKHQLEPIKFTPVYPLFAVSDIRGSSTLRNRATTEDLTDHLSAVRTLLQGLIPSYPIEYFKHSLFLCEQYIEKLQSGMSAADEYQITQFLRKELKGLLGSMEGLGDDARQSIAEYKSLLGESQDILYRARGRFDRSIAALNVALGKHIDFRQRVAQQVCPHYFLRRATDGVEHEIYIGAGVLPEPRRYQELFLRNLRLWQLVTVCECYELAESMREQLEMPLSMAHLIFVQDQTMTIQFDYEQRELEVEGAYNIRYEIVKKRIDKAQILGTKKRLTSPHKLAIVYSRESEAKEYLEYTKYMVAQGYIEPEVERLELEEMPGIHGLKALRFQLKRRVLSIDLPSFDQKNQAQGQVDESPDGDRLEPRVPKLDIAS